MEIKKLFKATNYPYHYVLKTVDDQYKMFLITPFRQISEKDLKHLPAYIERGNKAEEAEAYIYKLYGLTKI